MADARRAYENYARLLPESPEPQMLLLNLALTARDATAARASVEALKAQGGSKSTYWRVARVLELMMDSGQDATQDTAKGSRLEEAERLVAEVQKIESQGVAARPFLEGRVKEKQGDVDRAVKKLTGSRACVDLGGGPNVLWPRSSSCWFASTGTMSSSGCARRPPPCPPRSNGSRCSGT